MYRGGFIYGTSGRSKTHSKTHSKPHSSTKKSGGLNTPNRVVYYKNPPPFLSDSYKSLKKKNNNRYDDIVRNMMQEPKWKELGESAARKAINKHMKNRGTWRPGDIVYNDS
jgi:hypothetical protein